jgi:hypothetical protein
MRRAGNRLDQKSRRLQSWNLKMFLKRDRARAQNAGLGTQASEADIQIFVE